MTAPEDYDFIRFTIADLCGAARGKVIPRPYLSRAFKDGVAVFAGVHAFGPLNQIPINTIKEVLDAGCSNLVMIPDMTSLHPIPWSTTSSKYKTAQVLCGGHNEDTLAALQHCPRNAALAQLKQLDALGYKLLSSFEIEVMVFHKDGRVPLFPAADYSTILRMGESDLFISEVWENMTAAGVPIECMHTEYAPGQFEFNIAAQHGIKGADNAFKFKQGLKEICSKQGKLASFLAKPDGKLSGSGCHFNLSLWNFAENTSAFFDSSKPDNMSDVARYFLGGLQAHAAALTALCSPTVNCYRRLHQPWAPDINNWGIGDRSTTFRVKAATPAGSLIENRIPSGVCNPYLVLAATIAAGLDGIENHLEPTAPRDQKADKLPVTLSEALEALDTDKRMREKLGDSLVDWFVKSKRETDLTALKNSIVDNPDDKDGILAEIEQYEGLC